MSDVDGCHQYVAYQPTTEERAAQGVPEEMFKYPINGVEMTVHVGRGLNLTFDAYSLELVHQNTSLNTDDFYKHLEKIDS